MTIAVGDRIPNATLKTMGPNGVSDITTDELFKGKKVILFALPGAFTPTCSAKHLPSFIQHRDALTTKGVDTVACLSVNDAFVMDAWGKQQGAGDKVVMLADGNGEFTEKLGLSFDASGFGMGKRSKRYAMVIEDGKVTALNLEAPGAYEVSSAEAVLKLV